MDRGTIVNRLGRDSMPHLSAVQPIWQDTCETGEHRLRALPAGGAWTIGYKAWGSLLGRRLSKHGVLCYCIDYRNFPQARRSLQALTKPPNTTIEESLESENPITFQKSVERQELLKRTLKTLEKLLRIMGAAIFRVRSSPTPFWRSQAPLPLSRNFQPP